MKQKNERWRDEVVIEQKQREKWEEEIKEKEKRHEEGGDGGKASMKKQENQHLRKNTEFSSEVHPNLDKEKFEVSKNHYSKPSQATDILETRKPIPNSKFKVETTDSSRKLTALDPVDKALICQGNAHSLLTPLRQPNKMENSNNLRSQPGFGPELKSEFGSGSKLSLPELKTGHSIEYESIASSVPTPLSISQPPLTPMQVNAVDPNDVWWNLLPLDPETDIKTNQAEKGSTVMDTGIIAPHLPSSNIYSSGRNNSMDSASNQDILDFSGLEINDLTVNNDESYDIDVNHSNGCLIASEDIQNGSALSSALGESRQELGFKTTKIVADNFRINNDSFKKIANKSNQNDCISELNLLSF
mmetsp:Transcript_27820/g.51444  ORF Transcript_27820/g.51444 Transcript_27820/m.51444 type:complete len:359 (+) Transcript_27820:1107-2183(+)